MVLRYFGEPAAETCDACDNCSGTGAERTANYPDSLYQALLELREYLARRTRRAPYQVMETRTVRELATHRPRDREELLETYGIGDVKADWFGENIVRSIESWEKAHPDASGRMPRPYGGRARTRVSSGRGAGRGDDSEVLFQRLREWRLERAKQDQVPAYVVFKDDVLWEIAARRPITPEELHAISGVGPKKLGLYGIGVIEVVSETMEDPGRD